MHTYKSDLLLFQCAFKFYILAFSIYFYPVHEFTHFEFVAVHPGIALPMKHACAAVFEFVRIFEPEMLSAVQVGCDYTVNQQDFLADIWHSASHTHKHRCCMRVNGENTMRSDLCRVQMWFKSGHLTHFYSLASDSPLNASLLHSRFRSGQRIKQGVTDSYACIYSSLTCACHIKS